VKEKEKMAEFRNRQILRDEVLKELAIFDEKYPDTNNYENWLNDGAYKFALKYAGRLYPPKYILSQVTGLPVSGFSGGEETNSIFEELGFAVRDKVNHAKYWKIAPGQVARLWDRCVRDGNIAVGWNELGDLTPILGDYSKLKDHYAKTYTDEAPSTRGKQVNQLWQFLKVTEGDIIVANKGIKYLVGRGRVTGGYQYRSDYEAYRNIIPVEWFDTTERPVPSIAKDIAAPWFGLTLQELTEEEYLKLFSNIIEAPELSVLEKKKQIILYGPPGTGKTYSTKLISMSLLSEKTKNINEDLIENNNSNDVLISEKKKYKVWIFQANPDRYRMVEALLDPHVIANMSWTVSQFKKQIHKGDIAMNWVSGEKAGIYAVSEIITDPDFIQEDPHDTKYWVNQVDRKEGYFAVRLKIIANLANNPILKAELQNVPGLENFSILKFFQGTNFPVTDTEWDIIKRTFSDKLGGLE
jgi:hypothetical protein